MVKWDFNLDFFIKEDMGFKSNSYGERNIGHRLACDVGNVTCCELDKVGNLGFEPISWSKKFRTLSQPVKKRDSGQKLISWINKIWALSLYNEDTRFKICAYFMKWEKVVGHDSNLWCRENYFMLNLWRVEKQCGLCVHY